MSFLCNIRWCNFTGSNSPNWLISNYQVSPLSYIWTVVWNSFKLLFNNFHGSTIFSVLKLFSNTCNNLQSIVQCNFGFDCNILIAFIEERSSFRMPCNRPCYSDVKKLISGNISSVCTSFVLRDILSHHFDISPIAEKQIFPQFQQMDICGSHADIHWIWIETDILQSVLSKFFDKISVSIWFPVSSNHIISSSIAPYIFIMIIW